jgi:hypothetical protein
MVVLSDASEGYENSAVGIEANVLDMTVESFMQQAFRLAFVLYRAVRWRMSFGKLFNTEVVFTGRKLLCYVERNIVLQTRFKLLNTELLY